MTEQRFDINDLLAEARATLVRQSAAQAHGARGAGALLLDTRTAEDRMREGVIPGSIHMPLSVIQWRVDAASGYAHPAIQGFEQTLIVVCNEGYSSSLAAASLKRLGFVNATDLIGGFRGWKAHGYPVCDVREAASLAPRSASPVRTALKGWLYRVFLRVFQ
jgi:rhodanese-related sulfurtransferase